MTVAELRKALEGVPDDARVRLVTFAHAELCCMQDAENVRVFRDIIQIEARCDDDPEPGSKP